MNTTRGLYEQGQHVIPLDIDGSGTGIKEPEGSPEFNRQAEILKEWIESRSEPKINLLGQSLSAVTLLYLAKNNPDLLDRINAVLLVSPNGGKWKR